MKFYWLLFIVITLFCFSCKDKSDSDFENLPKTNTETNIDQAFEQIVKNDNLPNDSLAKYIQPLATLFTDDNISKEEAEKWYQKFIHHFEQQKNEAAIGQINRAIGNALCNEYNFDTGIPYLMKSSENFLKAKEYKALSKSYNNLSLAYHDFGDYVKGIEYANLALKTVNENPNSTNPNFKWYAYNNLGINYDDSKQYEKAIESHLNALPFAINASDSSYSYNNLGNTYKKLKQYEQSEKYFTLSLKHSSDYEDVYHFATLYSNLMDIERLVKNYPKAEKYVDSANFYALKSNSPEKLIDFYYYTYLLKNETKDYQSATEFLNKHVTLKDSLLNAEKAKIVYDYQIKYETEKKEKQIAETKLLSKQKNVWLILLAGSIIIGLGIFRNYSVKSKLKQQQLSLENELLKEQTHSKIQEQRLEISRDLHDSLGAQLTFINSILDGLKNASTKLDDTIKSKINTLSDFSENSITELKNTLWVLNSKEIYLDDLKTKILNFIKNASEAKEDIKFNFNFDVSENFNLNSKQAVNLFRAVQEIINNSLKYANATEIKIEVFQNDKNLNLKIADNGKGFDYEKEKNKSFGLQNIKTRIESINGTMNLKTETGQGTVYTIQLKIKN